MRPRPYRLPSGAVIEVAVEGDAVEQPALPASGIIYDPILSTPAFDLVTGGYYRLNLSSDGRKVWRVEAPELLANAHVRLLTIGAVEVHIQGQDFRAIEIDQAGAASFTFMPVRTGIYDLYAAKRVPAGRVPGGGVAPRR